MLNEPSAYRGVKRLAMTRGVCLLCRRPYQAGDPIIDSWRDDGSDSVEEHWHRRCWDGWQATARRTATPDKSITIAMTCDGCQGDMEIELVPRGRQVAPIVCPHCHCELLPSLPGPVLNVFKPGEGIDLN